MACAVSLSELESFDPGGGRGNAANLSYCCPFCGIDKPRDAAHRSLKVLAGTGLWNCKRCGEKGKLLDFWEERPKVNRRELARQQLRRTFDVPTTGAQVEAQAPNGEAQAKAELLMVQLEAACALEGTVGEKYLLTRGIPLDVALLAGVSFSKDFYGRPAAIFPLHNREGALVAAQGRYTDGRTDPKTRDCGSKSKGVFIAPTYVSGEVFTPFDARVPGVIICEAPVDALSLAACGFPALALAGIQRQHTKGPAWLRLACAFKTVFPAFDADEAGDEAAPAFSDYLGAYGARCATLRPEGAKDWNEALQMCGRDALSDWIAARVLV